MDITRPEALRAAREGLGQAPRPDVESLVGAAAQALRLHRYADAADILRGALLFAPERAEAWSLYGEALVALQRDDEARRALELALSLDDSDTLCALTLLDLYARVGARDEGQALATWLRSRGLAAELTQRFDAIARRFEV